MSSEAQFSRSEPGAPEEIDARLWLGGRTDEQGADYVKGLIERDGTVEFWGLGRRAVRQMKRVGALVEREGFAVMYEYRPQPGIESKQFGIRVAHSIYDLKGSVAARMRRT